MNKKGIEIAVPPPPRVLRGRRARAIWRSIASVASANGRLTRASEPLLIVLCRDMARVYREPNFLHGERISDTELRRIKDLARMFGIVQLTT
jgi:hypothetical protein